MHVKRPPVASNSWKNVILIALVYVIRLTDTAAISGIDSSTNESSETASTLTTSPTPTCKLVSNFTFDCSNLKLTAIPKSIPNSILHLNMSNNELLQLEEGAFDDCCENLTVLDLSHNELTKVHQRNFEKLKNLEILHLSANKLTRLDDDTFADLTSLKRLDLSHNEVYLTGSMSKGFLIQQELEELNLDFCQIEEIPDGTFTNMSQLRNLTLFGNPLYSSLDTSAFEPLKNLLKLEIAAVSQPSIYALCEKLTGIDIISLDDYNISCTILGDDEPFDESIVPNDPVEQPLVVFLTTTVKPSTIATTTTSSIPTTSSEFPAESTSTTAKPHLILTEDKSATNKTKIDTATSSIDIDIETIKFILVGIFAVTVIGILIGLICRADICGIKTKLCRTKKTTTNRREPADTVSPFEEIPLNTVVNGKATEGQG